MTTVDLALMGVVAVFGLSGLLSGALRQLAHWTALALAAFAARPLAARLIPLAPAAPRLPPDLVYAAAVAASFTLISVGGGLLLSLAVRRLMGTWSGGRADRAVGFALGAAKGAVGAFATIALLLAFERPLTARFGPPPPAARDSAAVAVIRRHNPLETAAPPVLAKLRALLDGARDPKTAAALAENPEIKALMNDPALKAALSDPALSAALKSGDWAKLLKDPRLAPPKPR